jgi:hypothetical protein
VELDEPVGKHAGRGLFTCSPRHGVFVPPSSVVSAAPSSVVSAAPSSVVSAAPSSVVSAAPAGGAATEYWDFRHKRAEPRDLGHRCRECKQAFAAVGEEMAVRRGGRIELRYHARCFSGEADPRSQAGSSFHDAGWGTVISEAAPEKRFRKMRTASHWGGGVKM